MRLILVRHGQTTSNLGGLLDTDSPGALLTALGQRQAAALPRALDGQPVDALVASTLVRTQQTAAPLAAGLRLPVHVDEGIREVRAGALEMRRDPDSVRTYLHTVLRWGSGELDLRMPGAETGAEVLGRYDEVVARLAADGAGTAVLVSHGAVIRFWAAVRARNLSIEAVAGEVLDNTGVVVLDGDPANGWQMLSWAGQAVGGAELPGVAGAVGPAGEPLDR